MRHRDASTRRAALDRIAAAAVLTAVAPVAAIAGGAGPHPDAALLALGAELDAAWACERAAWARLREGWTEAGEAEAEGLAAANGEIVRRIVPLPARTLDGLEVKARAVVWCYAGRLQDLDDLDDPDDATSDRLAYSAIRDLVAMTGRAC